VKKIFCWSCIVAEGLCLLLLWEYGHWECLVVGLILPPLVAIRVNLRPARDARRGRR
jgi:hypothetical protein